MMMQFYSVIKRDGRIEPFNVEKIHKLIRLCSKDISDRIQPEFDLYLQKLNLVLKPKMYSYEILRNLYQTAVDITANPNTIDRVAWSIFANRLLLIDFKKDQRIKRINWLQERYEISADEAKQHVNRYAIFTDPIDYINWLEHYQDVYDERLFRSPYRELIINNYQKLLLKRFKNPLWSIRHFQLQKLIKSYLTRYNSEIIELPEELWLLHSVLGFGIELERFGTSEQIVEQYIQQHFDYLASFAIVPATPQMLNLRKRFGNLASCFILDVHDNTESIMHTAFQIAQISRNGGGIGIYLGELRPSNSMIRRAGKANNVADWGKMFSEVVYNFNQLGVRKGSATLALPVWHKDIIEFLELIDIDVGNTLRKAPDVFTQVVLTRSFIEAVRAKSDYLLFDRHELFLKGYGHLDLVDKYGKEELNAYREIERLANSGVLTNVKRIKPTTILSKIYYYLARRGLPYIVFEDNLNRYSPFKEKIKSANLCVESVSPFNNTNEFDSKTGCAKSIGTVHTCNITNVNLPVLYEKGILFNDRELLKFVEHLYRYMDNLIELTDAPIAEAERHNQLYRTVTAGFIGLADLFAVSLVDTIEYNNERIRASYRYNKRNLSVSDIKRFIQTIFGRFAFLALYSSYQLAKERGKAPKFDDTKYVDNILLGVYKVNACDSQVCELYNLKTNETLDIDSLFTSKSVSRKIRLAIQDIPSTGLRNTLLLNCPPNTSTSVLAGSSAGVLPPYNLLQVEDQQTGLFVTFVRYPQYRFAYDVYSTQFTDLTDYTNLIDIVAEIQNFIDASISFEVTVNHNYFNTAEQITRLFNTIISYSYRKGLKTIYYWRHILPDTEISGASNCESCAN